MSVDKFSSGHDFFDSNSPKVKKDIAALNSWKIRIFLLQNLPTAIWWGLKVKSCSPFRTIIEVPYNWRTQNPFKSIYFAALAGAGELSSGLMAGLIVKNTQTKISMLVTNVEVDFIKKANSNTTFICDEGIKIVEAVQQAIQSGKGVEVVINAVGAKKNGEVVAKFSITWSFRVK